MNSLTKNNIEIQVEKNVYSDALYSNVTRKNGKCQRKDFLANIKFVFRCYNNLTNSH